MLLGFNMLLWVSQVSEEHHPLIARIKEVGYDGVELPLFSGVPEDYVRVGRILADHGLRSTAVCVIPDAARDCTSSDPKARAAGLEHLKWAIDCLEAAGGEVLCGPYYQPLAAFSGLPPTAEELDGIVEVHKAAARHAARANIRLAVEPLNRFECYALNTVASAADIVRRVDEPNYGMLYDTFHTNIEEKDPVGEYTRHRPAITHVHLSENDRGTPGKGHVPWDDVLGTIKRSGYDQWFVIEAFGRALPGIAAATKVWRDFFPDPDEVVKFGHDFLRRTWAAS